MIDLHCHILPGIDDGAKTMDDSLAMAHAAVAEGITHILATPHYKNGRWDNEKIDILRDVENLQNELNNRDIPLTVFPGQEVRIIGELIEDIQRNKIQFIDETNQYLLIEFPTATIPAFTDSLFFSLQTKGITPIIVHPERNHAILNDSNKLLTLIEKGALAQLTAGSYVGTFGKKTQKLSKQLIEAGLVHFIASDAHNVQSRTFHLKEAYEKLEKEFDKKKVQQFKQTTKDLINGEIIVTNPPKEVKTSKFLGLF
ncbi:tyrosine-protein phosphatase [Carnobacterium antarcticum]|uniref:Tyrosine-protein phosphatase n=1 Tax=Carnobacterium antarcticum TaxID=2126436 RepID=A0ABW4NKE1_9LACT|nr:CpsB/CapC family capsule biosynthesis tyrosine phosphatase [Carnobacterium sp. CP1]ALV21546.1 Manganese-dependent protein-tyrosine phosphatase [Carnobacterium sp. CP1]